MVRDIGIAHQLRARGTDRLWVEREERESERERERESERERERESERESRKHTMTVSLKSLSSGSY